MKNYEELANAIVLQAVRDYRDALGMLAKNPNSILANRDKSDCERFFLGKWFSELTGIDGKQLMNKLQKEAEQS